MCKKVPDSTPPPPYYMHHWLQTINKYEITTYGTIPTSESFPFQNTGKWSGVASNKYGKGHATNIAVLKMTSSSSEGL